MVYYNRSKLIKKVVCTMVIKAIQDDVFNTDAKHIAFAINKEGINDAGFSGQVTTRYWGELTNCGVHEIGTIFSKQVGDKTFHAMVCHSLKSGWGENQAQIIKECFDKIPANGETIATVAIGDGIVGMFTGADFRQIVCGMHESKQQITLYSRYTLDAVINCYSEEKEKQETNRQKKIAMDLHNKGVI